MENRAHALAAGLFLILLAGFALLAVIWFRGDHIERRPLVIVTRESIAGLNVKAAVRLRGVDVGKVESIDFDPADPRQILIGLQVNSSAPLTRGAYAQLGYQGVTGLSFVALADTGTDPRPLPDRGPDGSAPPRIALQPTLLDQLANAGPRLLNGANLATERVNAVLSDSNRAHLEQALSELAGALTQINHSLAALQPAAQAMPALVQHVDQVTRHADAVLLDSQQTLASLAPVVGRLDHSLQGFDQLTTDAGGLTRDLRERAGVLDRLGSAAAQLESSTRHLEAALGGDSAVATPLLPELGRTSQTLAAAARQLGDQPQSLLFGRAPVPPGPGEAGFDARSRGASAP